MFHQSRFIETLITFGVIEDMEETYGNILSTDVLGNMNIINKKDVIQPHGSLMIKLDNLGVIQEDMNIVREESGVTLIMRNNVEDPEGIMYKISR